eukprot:SAG31_NODE_595_length_13695_cov_11.446896_13_plen_243_part_00
MAIGSCYANVPLRQPLQTLLAVEAVHLGKYTQCYKCWKKYSTWPATDELGKPTYWVHQREGGATTATTTCQWRKKAGVWTRQQHGDTDGTDQRVLFAAQFKERPWAQPSPTDTGSPAVQPRPRQPDPRRPDDGWNAPATRAGAPADVLDGWGSSTELPQPSSTGQRGRQAETATARRTASELNKTLDPHRPDNTERASPPAHYGNPTLEKARRVVAAERSTVIYGQTYCRSIELHVQRNFFA